MLSPRHCEEAEGRRGNLTQVILSLAKDRKSQNHPPSKARFAQLRRLAPPPVGGASSFRTPVVGVLSTPRFIPRSSFVLTPSLLRTNCSLNLLLIIRLTYHSKKTSPPRPCRPHLSDHLFLLGVLHLDEGRTLILNHKNSPVFQPHYEIRIEFVTGSLKPEKTTRRLSTRNRTAGLGVHPGGCLCTTIRCKRAIFLELDLPVS